MGHTTDTTQKKMHPLLALTPLWCRNIACPLLPLVSRSGGDTMHHVAPPHALHGHCAGAILVIAAWTTLRHRTLHGALHQSIPVGHWTAPDQCLRDQGAKAVAPDVRDTLAWCSVACFPAFRTNALRVLRWKPQAKSWFFVCAKSGVRHIKPGLAVTGALLFET